MKTIFTLLSFLFFISFGLVAQEDYDYEEEEMEQEPSEPYIPKFSLGLNFAVGIPLEAFNDNIDGLAYGFNGNFLVRANPKSEVPVLIGLSSTIATYDIESQDQIIFIDGYSVDARLTTKNNIFTAHAIFRFLPPVNNFPIQPYFDGLIGFKNLFTRTRLEDLDAPDDDDTIESYIEQGDWTFSYGGALGFQVLVGGGDEVLIMLDGKCTYILGNAADYLVRIDNNNVQIDQTIDAFEEVNSTTNMLIPHIGVSLIF